MSTLLSEPRELGADGFLSAPNSRGRKRSARGFFPETLHGRKSVRAGRVWRAEDEAIRTPNTTSGKASKLHSESSLDSTLDKDTSPSKPRDLGADDVYPRPNPEAASEAREAFFPKTLHGRKSVRAGRAWRAEDEAIRTPNTTSGKASKLHSESNLDSTPDKGTSPSKPRDLGADDVYPRPNPEAASEAREDFFPKPCTDENPSVRVVFGVRMMKPSARQTRPLRRAQNSSF